MKQWWTQHAIYETVLIIHTISIRGEQIGHQLALLP